MAIASSTALPVRSEAPSRSAAVAGRLGGLALGLVLLAAAALKALDPAAFGEEIGHQGVSFGLPLAIAALVALGIEAALGVALALDLRSRRILLAATALVAGFLFLTGRSAWRAAHGEADAAACGCFGALVERTPAEAFRQDLALLVPALALAWLGRPGARSHRRRRGAAALVAGAVVALFAAAAPRLPLDDVATRLRPGARLEALCAGAGDERVCLSDLAPALASGRHLVVLADPADARFAALAARLNGYARQDLRPPLSVVADLTPEARQALYWEIAPAFELQEAPRSLLRPLYRRLPRSFELADGAVVETWDGLPPAVESTETATP